MEPYFDDGQVTLYQGDVRAVLRELPADSVNCVVTSPPYWSLRDYGVEPTVWGEPIATTMNPCPHGSPETWECCHRGYHQWGETVEQQRGGTYSGKTRWQHIADEANEEGVPVRSLSPESWGLEDGHPAVASGSFCGRTGCGAWLGALGLEPTPELFVAHTVEVFREVRRVLRPDGTLWLNMGDSYAGSWGGASKTQYSRTEMQQSDTGSYSLGPDERPLTANPGAYGLKPKDLVGIPWMLAFALRTDGWWLRQDIIWSKPNPMPESVRDRCTKAHEYLFLLSKRERYWSDFGAIREAESAATKIRLSQENLDAQPGGSKADAYADQFPGKRGRDRKPTEILKSMASKRNSFARETSRPLQPGEHTVSHRPEREDIAYEGSRNKRSVWHIPTAPFPEAHFATFPPALVAPCILAGCPDGGVVLDPFVGSGTTAMVARQLGRRAIGIDLNPEYLAMAVKRVGSQMALLGEAAG